MTDKLTSPLGAFKEREIEILELMAQGDSNVDIADKLFISKTTVRWYNKNIYSKLGTSRRTEAIALAREMGLIEGVGSPSLPAPGASTRKHNLPTIATPFLGRGREIADLKDRLTTSNTPLITLLAPGGMGKTRLSIELGHQLLDSFNDGVYLFELAPLNQASDIIKTALSTLGLSEETEQEAEETMFNACRGKKMLFIFDNFEELLDGAGFISNLIRNLPDARVLVTSRERLNLHGEMVYELRGLLESGTALFVATAKAMQAHFELEKGEESAVQEIVSFVGGMPLAIILAASWTESLSVSEIAEEVQSSLDLLETEMRNIPERQQSIRGVLAASWQKLSQNEQAVCMKLAIFKGGFSRGAATQIAQASLPILRKLQHRSFVQKVSDRRYDLHPLIRQFGMEQLETNHLLNETHQQHLAYFQQHIKETLEGLDHGDFVYPLNQVQLEHDNVRLALDWGIEHKDRLATLLVISMIAYWGHRTHFQEALHYLSKVIPITTDKRQQLELRIRRNGALVTLLRSAEAELDSRAVLQEAEELGDLPLKLQAMDQLVIMLSTQSTLEHPLLEQYVTLSKEVGDRREIVRALTIRGLFYGRSGQFEQGLATELEALQLARELEDDGQVARLSYNAAVTLGNLNRHEEAKPLLTESLALKKLIGDRAGTIYRLSYLASIAIQEQRIEDAEQFLAEGFVIIKQIEEEVPNRKVTLLICKGDWYAAQSAWSEALPYFKDALALSRQTNYAGSLPEILLWLVLVYSSSGALGQAQHSLIEAAQLINKSQQLKHYSRLLFSAAIYFEAQSDFARSAEYYVLFQAEDWPHLRFSREIETLEQSLKNRFSKSEWEELVSSPVKEPSKEVLDNLQKLLKE
ncbi:MAG: LuxR C-terminal-related transcriptional regulator [Anaerolineae bacterium]